jgi:hypothetical protein
LALLLISDFFSSLISFWTVKVPIPTYQAIIQWWWWWPMNDEWSPVAICKRKSNVSFSVSSKDDRLMKIFIIVDDDEYVSRERNVYIRINYIWERYFVDHHDFMSSLLKVFWMRRSISLLSSNPSTVFGFDLFFDAEDWRIK